MVDVTGRSQKVVSIVERRQAGRESDIFCEHTNCIMFNGFFFLSQRLAAINYDKETLRDISAV